MELMTAVTALMNSSVYAVRNVSFNLIFIPRHKKVFWWFSSYINDNIQQIRVGLNKTKMPKSDCVNINLLMGLRPVFKCCSDFYLLEQ